MDKLFCILLVDDDDTTNFLHQSLLEDLQVSKHILVARNGRQALELIENQCAQGLSPDLIILDINMPVMNGFEFLAAYENLDFICKQSVVVVMLTTSINPADIQQLQQGMVQGFLNKPLTEEMVRQLLQTHFNRLLPQS